MLKPLLKKAARKSTTIKKILQLTGLQKQAFHSASAEPFSYLDKQFGKKTIDHVFSKAFDELFILLKLFRLQGDIFEFGVFEGYTAKLFAQRIKKFKMNETSLHLFDSFIGLPEEKELDKNSYEYAESVWKKGMMQVTPGLDQYIHRKLAKILSYDRIHVIKGYFENTLETYFSQVKTKAQLVHLDCDLYSSSKYVLNFLLEREVIQDGTIVIFDDWMTSLGNPNLGQRKATSEILEKFPYWNFEKYLNYGVGSHAFIAHDLRVKDATSAKKSPAHFCNANSTACSVV